MSYFCMTTAGLISGGVALDREAGGGVGASVGAAVGRGTVISGGVGLGVASSWLIAGWGRGVDSGFVVDFGNGAGVGECL